MANARQPIVTIMGHVDHGKTTLLDYIRKAHVAAGEAGGITQAIGAYQATYKDKKLTFIDTPGHAAFSKMRSRGAQVTDLAVLVIAADDGVMPQTVESISHLKDAKVPFIVALNKSDHPAANPDMVKSQLTEHEVFVEGYGGNTPVVSISAKTGAGVDDLLDNLLLMAELEELAAKPDAPLKAVVIEVKKDAHRGTVASVIVKEGTLHTQDRIQTPSASGRVRALLDEAGKQVKSAGPSEPVLVLGFDTLPQVGEVVTAASAGSAETTVASPQTPSITPQPTDRRLKLIIKADTEGALEAIKGSLSEEVLLILAGTGDISESDVLLAGSTGALILGFNVKVPSSVTKLAETDGVFIKTYRIIYELLEYLEKKVLKLMEPTIDEEVLGEATVLKVFKIDGDTVAGCRVVSGNLSLGDTVHLKKLDGILKNARIRSLKTGKLDVKKVAAGAECGLLLVPNLDVQEKDVIIPYKKIQQEE